MFSWQKRYLTRSLRSPVRYRFCHSNILIKIAKMLRAFNYLVIVLRVIKSNVHAITKRESNLARSYSGSLNR